MEEKKRKYSVSRVELYRGEGKKVVEKKIVTQKQSPGNFSVYFDLLSFLKNA